MSMYFHDTECPKSKHGDLVRIGKKGCRTCKLIEKVANNVRSGDAYDQCVYLLPALNKRALKDLAKEVKRELSYLRER